MKTILSIFLSVSLLLSSYVSSTYAMDIDQDIVSFEDGYKPPIPKDPRPEPKTLEDFERYRKMPDPTADTGIVRLGKMRSVINKGNFDNFSWGDIVLGKNYFKGDTWYPYGYWRHASIYDRKKREFISANLGEGVHVEKFKWWKEDWKTLSGLNVYRPCVAIRKKATAYARSMLGKPYKITYNKDDERSWYCSKLPYVSYKKNSRIDLSNNSLWYITPDDLYYSKETRLWFAQNITVPEDTTPDLPIIMPIIILSEGREIE